MVSDAVLAGTGIGVFWYYFQRVVFYNKLLWGFFLLTISMTALVGVFTFAGLDSLEPLHQSLEILAGSLGVVCVVMAVWALLNRQAVQLTGFSVTLALGLALFVVLMLPDVRVFAPVVQSLSMLIIMLLAVFGLLRQERYAIWIVLAIMILGLATKLPSNGMPLHSTDVYHYAVALALICFGKAVKASKL